MEGGLSNACGRNVVGDASGASNTMAAAGIRSDRDFSALETDGIAGCSPCGLKQPEQHEHLLMPGSAGLDVQQDDAGVGCVAVQQATVASGNAEQHEPSSLHAHWASNGVAELTSTHRMAREAFIAVSLYPIFGRCGL